VEEVKSAVIKPKARSEVIEEWIGQEIFLYDQNNGQEVHCLNSGAALIWLLCDGTRNVEAIALDITQAFHLPDGQVLGEVQETVARLDALGLVESGT